MNQYLELARRDLLEPAGIDEQGLQGIFSTLCSKGIEQADLYFQSGCAEGWALEEGIIRGGSFHVSRGVGVRALSGDRVGFAYSDDIVLPALEQAAKAARAIGRLGGQPQAIAASRWDHTHALYLPVNPLLSLDETQKVALLQMADRVARAADPRIIQVNASLAAEYDVILVTDSEGHLAADVRPLVRFNVSVVAEQNGRREHGSAGGGGRHTLQQFIDMQAAETWAKDAVRQALLNLEAIDAPAGSMPVVLGPGWPGVLLHEAVGHGLEGDFNRKGTSLFSGRVGQQVVSPLCTVVDDGTLPGRRGSLNVDDEGVPTQRTVLIEKGILKGYLQDRQNARLMGVASTGNGRRESYACLPMPRMTNTFLLPGESEPEEIIASVKKGIYAVNFGGGQVDITSGKFVFSTSEAWLIEEGRLTAPLRGATLTGMGPEVLSRVSMVGNNLELDTGVGTCGKDGQSVPVGVGQPTVKIDAMTVGGTRHE